MRGRKKLVWACIVVAALATGIALGGGAGWIAFGLACDFDLWTPHTGGFSSGYEALGVAGLFVLVGAGVGACFGLTFAVWLIRRLNRARRIP